jgi:signal transduction histidine kinase
MNAIIDDLFELAQLDTGHLILKLESISVSDLISDTLEGFSLRARERGIALTGEVEPNLGTVCCAPEKIGRVLSNLVENALRHTPAGGSIRLSAGRDKESIVVSVGDTGEGISAQDLPRIFERFYRGERSRSREGYEAAKASTGVGLGLAIAKGLIDAHGGKIWAESEVGKGTTMKFSIPLSARS